MPILNWIGKDKVINHHQDVPYDYLNRIGNDLEQIRNYFLGYASQMGVLIESR